PLDEFCTAPPWSRRAGRVSAITSGLPRRCSLALCDWEHPIKFAPLCYPLLLSGVYRLFGTSATATARLAQQCVSIAVAIGLSQKSGLGAFDARLSESISCASKAGPGRGRATSLAFRSKTPLAYSGDVRASRSFHRPVCGGPWRRHVAVGLRGAGCGRQSA